MTAKRIGTDLRETRYLDYPYTIGTAGIPALTGAADHLRDLILQILFTIPGERVNLPEFGVGVQRLIFAPNSDALRASTQMLITTGLRRWLGDRIDVTQVLVTSELGEEETVTIEIIYAIKATQERQSLQVTV